MIDLRAILNRIPSPLKEAVKAVLYPTLPAVGEPAPQWNLTDQNGKAHTLPDSSWTVLVFYPSDDTPGCTMQLAEFQQQRNALQAANIAVFGVNPAGAHEHGAFAEKCGFDFPLLVDTAGDVAAAYGCALRLPLGMRVVRTVVLIGPDQTIRMAERGMPAVDTILRIVGPI